MAEKKLIVKKANSNEEVVEDVKETSIVEVDGRTTSNYVQGNLVAIDEDGVSEELPLLAGYVDSDGVRHMTFTCREMTGKDEETLAKNEFQTNGAKAESKLLELCVESVGTLYKSDCTPKFWGEVIRDMYVGDRSFMSMKIREVSIGTALKVRHKCPSCKQTLNTVLETYELDVLPFTGMYETPFSLPKGYKDKNGVVHTEGHMRLAKGIDAEITMPVSRKNISSALTLMLSRLCRFDDGTTLTTDIMNSLTKRDRDYLMNLTMDNTFGINQKVEVTCDSCGDTFEGDINTSNFI